MMGRGTWSFSVPTSDRGKVQFTLDPHNLVRGNVCTEENAWYVVHFISLYMSLLADSSAQCSTGLKPFRAYWSFFKRLTSMPIRDNILLYSHLSEEIMSSTYLTGTGSMTGSFVEGMRRTPIFKEYMRYFRDEDSWSLRYVLSFLRFGKKLKYEDPSFHAVAFRNWQAVERDLSSLVLPNDLSDLRKVVRAILPPLDPFPLYPKFGPGAVSESGVRGVIAKADNLAYDPKLDYAFSSGTFRKVFGDRTYPSLKDILPDAMRWDKTKDHSIRNSALRFVPKDVTKSRSICMEPNSYMYFQQVLLDWLKDSIRRGILRQFIFLMDQTENQRAAQHGSLYASVDTLDLSAASDRVSYRLVKQIFPREYLFYLMATRTASVETPLGVVDVEKFAPMGSAVCFPIQSIIFSAVVIYAMMLFDRCGKCGAFQYNVVRDEADVVQFIKAHVHTKYSEDTPFSEKYESFRVFGDDIICDSRVTERVTRVLTALGFVLNQEKSFTGSQAYRESCGEHYWAGTAVTPYMYTAQHYEGWLNPSAFASLVEAANNLYDLSYLNTRTAVLRILRSFPLRKDGRIRPRGSWNPILFTDRRESFGVFTLNPRNDHLKSRWNRSLQRTEWLCVVPVVRKKQYPTADEAWSLESYLYQQDMRARYYSNVSPDVTFGFARYRPEETGLKRRWMPR